ncbi:uncharacterized protein [Halyomorpha halys]|uniref:uncharacterized protein isoform X1 n=1 Tax=Halyomorpha halys TaxID=286706 RepID=UPI0034D24F9F
MRFLSFRNLLGLKTLANSEYLERSNHHFRKIKDSTPRRLNKDWCCLNGSDRTWTGWFLIGRDQLGNSVNGPSICSTARTSSVCCTGTSTSTFRVDSKTTGRTTSIMYKLCLVTLIRSSKTISTVQQIQNFHLFHTSMTLMKECTYFAAFSSPCSSLPSSSYSLQLLSGKLYACN